MFLTSPLAWFACPLGPLLHSTPHTQQPCVGGHLSQGEGGRLGVYFNLLWYQQFIFLWTLSNLRLETNYE